MRATPRVTRGHFQRESQRIETLDRARVPANGIAAPVIPTERQPETAPIAPVPATGQLTFAFYVPNCSQRDSLPRLSHTARHELAIAGWIVAEKRYAQPLLNWANRRLSVERYKAKRRRHAEELRRGNERQLAACEQRIATITRNLGMLVRKLDGLRFADTRTLVGITSEIRRLAANEAPPQ